MALSKKSADNTAAEKINYIVEVTRAKEIKEGRVVFDAKVNGISISGLSYQEYKTKDGAEGSLISMPSQKGKDGNYYNICWFPVSKELKENIVAQLENLL